MPELAQHLKMGNNVTFASDTVIGDHVTIGNNVTFYPGVTVQEGCTIFDGAVIGRPPLSAGNTTHPVNSSPRPLSVGAGSVIGANAVLYTGIQIGTNVLIGDLASIREGCVFGNQVVVGRGCLVMYDSRIGDRSRVIDGAILTGNMVVEEDVFMGPGVNSVNDNDVYLKRYGLEDFSVKGPIIRRFALIGTGANLAAGIEVGMGAIVAPSAMVTRDVAPWTIVAGVPAKFLKDVQPEMRERILAHFS